MFRNLSFMGVAFLVLIFSSQVEAADVKIDYGNSKVFSKADMDFCIEVIKKQLEENGCTLHSVTYVGDEKSNSKENIKYMNSLAEGNNFKKKFSKCLFLKTDFLSPKDPKDGKVTAWRYDTEYKDYDWYFGFYEVDGEWKLLTFGY